MLNSKNLGKSSYIAYGSTESCSFPTQYSVTLIYLYNVVGPWEMFAAFNSAWLDVSFVKMSSLSAN